MAETVQLTRLTTVDDQLDTLAREYVAWVVEQVPLELGVTFDDPAAVITLHHELFRQELPHFLSPAAASWPPPSPPVHNRWAWAPSSRSMP